jgi:hypothetical protein
VQEPQALLLEFLDPALVDLVDRHRVDEVELLAPLLHGGHQVGIDEHIDVLGGRLPRHFEVLA